MALAQGTQGIGEFGIQGDVDMIATIVLQYWARMVGRQFQQCRRVMQVLAPEAKLTLQQRPLEPTALPHGVIGILDRQRRQGIGLALHEGGVQRAQFLHQQRHRPAIRNDVVHGHQQTMLLLGQLQQATTDQRTTTQVEGRVGFLFGLILRGDLGIWRVAQICTRQRKAYIRRSNRLGGAVVVGHEAGAQGFVAGDDAIQRLLQRGQIQRAVQVHAAGEGVSLRGATVELCQEPQPLLRVGQWQCRVTVGRHNGRQGAGIGTIQGLCQFDQTRLSEQRSQRQFQSQRAADTRNQPHTEQRVTTEGEEVVVTPDVLQAKQFTPDRSNGLFDFPLRCFIRMRRIGRAIRCG